MFIGPLLWARARARARALQDTGEPQINKAQSLPSRNSAWESATINVFWQSVRGKQVSENCRGRLC